MPRRALLSVGLMLALAACGSNQVDRIATGALTGAAVGGTAGGPIGIVAGGALGAAIGATLPKGVDQAVGLAPEPKQPG